MRKNTWTLVFTSVLIIDLAATWFGNEEVQYIVKPLIIPALAGYFYFGLRNIRSGLKKWILTALLFSWTGDVLLMFVDNNSIFFLLGLSAFLLAHIFYILFFHYVRIHEQLKSNPWLMVIVVVYYAGLISWLSPFLGVMKIPVRVYGVVISMMLMLAMHMLYIKNQPAGRRMLAGALLFVVSDTLLAINKFYQSFEAAGVLIMLTYGVAQFFMVEGAIRYIRQVNSN